jgi:predicted RNA polymerase sigma factor
MLEKLGRREEARLEFTRAASMTENLRQRNRLIERARARSGVPSAKQ